MITIIIKDFFVFKDHINYVKKLIGPDHIGIGSDYDGIEMYAYMIAKKSDYIWFQ